MQISGHRSPSVFDRYDIVTEEDIKRAARRQHDYISEIRHQAAKRSNNSSLDSLNRQCFEGQSMLRRNLGKVVPEGAKEHSALGTLNPQ